MLLCCLGETLTKAEVPSKDNEHEDGEEEDVVVVVVFEGVADSERGTADRVKSGELDESIEATDGTF